MLAQSEDRSYTELQTALPASSSGSVSETLPGPVRGLCSDTGVVPHVDAIVVGAGWAGLWLMHRLRQRKLRCLLLEAHGEVGGVWATTRYPGCRNETETPVYQFSAEETWSSWNWTERFPARKDVRAYLQHVCKVLDLTSSIVLNSPVSHASWTAPEQRWNIEVAGKAFATTQFFLPCTGYASLKWIPKIKGLDSFIDVYHTSEWPENLSLDRKRVGVLGTGSSGTQVIESIGPYVGHLTVFQRSPNFAIPRHQRILTAESEVTERKSYKERYAFMNNTPTGLEMRPLERSTFQDNAEVRRKTYQELWSKGAQNFWFGNYRDLLTNLAANKEAYNFWCSMTRPRIQDQRKRDILAPLEPPYCFGTKRPSLESGYFEVYNQSNVDLVSLKEDNIREIKPEGITLESGKTHDLDVIMLATGYDFGIGSILAIDIRGQDGISLRDKWDVTSASTLGGVKTYLGMICAGFPNMLMSCGPQAPTAFGITPRVAELQGDWIADLVTHVKEVGHTVDTSDKAERAWKAKIEEVSRETLIPETDGWYMGNNIPGRRKEALFWFGGLPEYMKCCQESANKHYEGFIIQ